MKKLTTKISRQTEFTMSRRLSAHNNKPLYSKTVSDKGVNSISDHTGLDGNFISWDLLSSKFDLTYSK